MTPLIKFDIESIVRESITAVSITMESLLKLYSEHSEPSDSSATSKLSMATLLSHFVHWHCFEHEKNVITRKATTGINLLIIIIIFTVLIMLLYKVLLSFRPLFLHNVLHTYYIFSCRQFCRPYLALCKRLLIG